MAPRAEARASGRGRAAGSRRNGSRSSRFLERQQAIVDTSAHVFADRGFHGTSTIELCEANGIGKGALYYYIGSKERLLAAIHDRVMDVLMAGADRVEAAGGSATEQLAMLGSELLNVIAQYPDHVWVFLHDFPALTGEYARQFRARRREFERRVEAVFTNGMDSGEFRDLDPKLATRAWLGMHNYTYLWLKAGGRLSANQVAKSFADIFVTGISRVPAKAPTKAAGAR
jgi:AcrR family transcriptional regulator